MRNTAIIINILIIMAKYSLEGIVKKNSSRSVEELKVELAKQVTLLNQQRLYCPILSPEFLWIYIFNLNNIEIVKLFFFV